MVALFSMLDLCFNLRRHYYKVLQGKYKYIGQKAVYYCIYKAKGRSTLEQSADKQFCKRSFPERTRLYLIWDEYIFCLMSLHSGYNCLITCVIDSSRDKSKIYRNLYRLPLASLEWSCTAVPLCSRIKGKTVMGPQHLLILRVMGVPDVRTLEIIN